MTGGTTPSSFADFAHVLAGARTGEAWALTALFRAYQPPLLRYLRALERSSADDLAGEVWLAVAERIGRFEGDERDFRAWIFTVARNRLADHRRRAVRRPVDLVTAEQLAAVPAAAGATEHVVQDRVASQEAIDRLVATLPADQAEIVLLRVVAGLSAEEVAAVTGRSAGAVRVAQHRALKRLALAFPPRLVTP